MGQYTKPEIEKKVNQLAPWLQNISLNGILTNSDKPNYPESR